MLSVPDEAKEGNGVKVKASNEELPKASVDFYEAIRNKSALQTEAVQHLLSN